jgi:hypothetical protein
MSLYSGALKVDYIDPRVDRQNNRAEFHLNKDTAYYSNLRVVNLGATASLDSSTITGLAGVYGLIKHIHLMDGGVILDSCRNVDRYLSFKNVNNKNDFAYSVGQRLNKAFVGYQLQDNMNVTAGGAIVRQFRNVDDANPDGWLDLRMCLPLLERITHLDTSKFENLKVVIEWSDRRNKTMMTANNRTLNTKTPLLVADEIRDQGLRSKLNNALKGVVWNSIDHDVVQVPEATAPTSAGDEDTQDVTLRVNAFDNRLVGRMLVMKSYTDKTIPDTDPDNGNEVRGKGDLCSVAQMEDSFNFRLNGSNVFSGDGVTKAKRAMMTVDSFGEVVAVPFGNCTAVGENVRGAPVNQIATSTSLDDSVESQDIGQYDFLGFDMSARCQQLFMNYKRTIPKDDDAQPVYSSGLDIHLYGEVQKSLTFQGDKYLITYN